MRLGFRQISYGFRLRQVDGLPEHVAAQMINAREMGGPIS